MNFMLFINYLISLNDSPVEPKIAVPPLVNTLTTLNILYREYARVYSSIFQFSCHNWKFAVFEIVSKFQSFFGIFFGI